jgi:ketosteroid isomerase-like protein
MSVEDNKEIARRGFEALMAGDLSSLEPLLAPDAVLHQCGFLDPIPGRAILEGEFPGRRRFPDREVRIERMAGEGDLVALHWWTTGRHSDPDSPALDGTRLSFPSMSFLRIANSRIAEIWNIQDTATLQTQLWQAAERIGST